MSPRVGRTLGGFHHRMAHQMEMLKLSRDMMGRFLYPPLYKAMMSAGMEEVETYVLCRQNNIAHYIATFPILEICLVAERQPGVQVTRQWWEQADLTFGHKARREAVGTGEL